MFYVGILVILIIIVLCIRFNRTVGIEFYEYDNNYPFDPPIQTPQSNYQDIMKKLDTQSQYKYDISVGLSPTPTVQCDKLKSKSDCNDNGCNWFGTYCSGMYPSYL